VPGKNYSVEDRGVGRKMQERKRIKNLATGGMLIALAFIFSYLESLLPVLIPVPGMKLGLANLVTVVAIYMIGGRAGFVISALRILLSGFTFSGLFSMIYSMAGGLLSFFGMMILKEGKKCSIFGVSMAGGALHNMGQIVVAALVLQSTNIFTYLGILLPVGVLTGLVIGIIASRILQSFRKGEEKFCLLDGVIAGSFVLAGILMLGGLLFIKKEGSRVIVQKDSSVYAEYPLSENGIYRLEWEDGSYNILTVQNGQAFMTEASCPDLLCVHERAISKTWESIVCLPNRVEILIKGAEEGDLDAIVE